MVRRCPGARGPGGWRRADCKAAEEQLWRRVGGARCSGCAVFATHFTRMLRMLWHASCAVIAHSSRTHVHFASFVTAQLHSYTLASCTKRKRLGSAYLT